MLHILFTSTGSDLSTFLNDGTSLLTWLLTSMASIINTIMSNGILLIGFLITLISFAFGLVFRSAGQR